MMETIETQYFVSLQQVLQILRQFSLIYRKRHQRKRAVAENNLVACKGRCLEFCVILIVQQYHAYIVLAKQFNCICRGIAG